MPRAGAVGPQPGTGIQQGNAGPALGGAGSGVTSGGMAGAGQAAWRQAVGLTPGPPTPITRPAGYPAAPAAKDLQAAGGMAAGHVSAAAQAGSRLGIHPAFANDGNSQYALGQAAIKSNYVNTSWSFGGPTRLQDESAAANPEESSSSEEEFEKIARTEGRTLVDFWGICDIKYDPRLTWHDRVRVLEFGDGRTSRFSHHGRAIKEKFAKEYTMHPAPIKRQVMTENKKFTHDVFVQAGFAHLRPPTASYPRRYTADLASMILHDLGISKESPGEVVLKLCNRSRGAGIVVSTAEDLDGALRRLLTPPLGIELQAWLEARKQRALSCKFADVMEENCVHWWSNECPVFVAERCCHSIPVRMAPRTVEKFDGTMRVAFALHRKKQSKKQKKEEVAQFEIDWLGGYWKLPRHPIAEDSEGALGSGSLVELHSTIVSSFNSAEKRTAFVPPGHLQEVFAMLTPALPSIFGSDAVGVPMIMRSYKKDDLFRAFALSRVAASLRTTEMEKALRLFRISRDIVEEALKDAHRSAECSPESLPECSVLSYIDRNKGVCSVLTGNWLEAGELWRDSLDIFPLNATAHYLDGCNYEQEGSYSRATASQMRAIALDPDFRSPYIALSNCLLRSGSFADALRAARAACQRFPDAPGAHFNIGQAIYHILRRRRDGEQVKGILPTLLPLPFSPDGEDEEDQEATVLAERAASSLSHARQGMQDQWDEADEAMIRYCQGIAKGEGTTLIAEDIPPVHIWKVYGFRP